MTAITSESYQSLLLVLQATQAELESRNAELRRARESLDYLRHEPGAARRRGDQRFAIDNTQQHATMSWVESEARFRAYFEQAAVGVAQVSIEGHWLDVNQKLCEILGYSSEELLSNRYKISGRSM